MRAILLASILALACAGTALAQAYDAGTDTGTTGTGGTGGTTGDATTDTGTTGAGDTGGEGTTTGDQGADNAFGAGSIVLGLLVIAGIVALVWYAASRRRHDEDVVVRRRRV